MTCRALKSRYPTGGHRWAIIGKNAKKIAGLMLVLENVFIFAAVFSVSYRVTDSELAELRRRMGRILRKTPFAAAGLPISNTFRAS